MTIDLGALGWTPELAAAFSPYEAEGLVPARVALEHTHIYRVFTASGEWLFASEIRALLAHPEVTPEMDGVAFWHYLTFIVAPAPLTMFHGIFKIPAGHRVTIDWRGPRTVTTTS